MRKKSPPVRRVPNVQTTNLVRKIAEKTQAKKGVIYEQAVRDYAVKVGVMVPTHKA